MRIKNIMMFSLLLCAADGALRAEELYFTYAGIVFGGGIEKIEYREWLSDAEGTGKKNISGNYYCGGAMLGVFVNYFIGEFSIQYFNNSNKDLPVGYILYCAKGKFSYRISDYFSLAAGPGLYIETPPATESYNGGGGFTGALGAVISPGREWKIIADLTASYGSFGIGEDSTRLSYGASVGIVYKVGRI